MEMTREEAIKNYIMPALKRTWNDDRCIEIISAIEQVSCENAVSRQDVLDLAEKGVLVSNGNYKSVCKAINELPPVNPQVKTGHWIDLDEKSAVCSCCNRNNTLYGDFCKWCGAIMLEPQERSGEK